MPWLPAQLDSLAAQTHPAWSLWVSDDGSTDGTRACLEDFAARHPGRVERVVTGPAQGSAANFLHLLCHPELPAGPVALCDQDDVWDAEKLALSLAALRGAGQVPAVWAARYAIADAGLTRAKPSARWMRPPSLANALVQNILSGHTLTLNAAALAHLRGAGIQPVPHHDWWIYLLMAATGARILVDDRLVLQYRQHDANLMGARHMMRLARLRGLFDGTMQSWISANVAALAQVDALLTPQARELVADWQNPDVANWRVMRRYGVHRQSLADTGILHLAAALGKV